MEQHAFDVYMVNGCIRFACIMASFLHASGRGKPTDRTIVLNLDCMPTVELHNELYSGMRKSYKAADHWLDLVDHSGSCLCTNRRKRTTTDDGLIKAKPARRYFSMIAWYCIVLYCKLYRQNASQRTGSTPAHVIGSQAVTWRLYFSHCVDVNKSASRGSRDKQFHFP